MKIAVASKNPNKIAAVEETLQDYAHLKDAVVEGMDTATTVSDQPRSIEEVVEGAVQRARNVYEGHDYSVGLESGLIAIPQTKSGYLDVAICAIYDGKEMHIGMSPGFETTDPAIFRSVIEDGIDLSEATKRAGLTKSEYVGWEGGIVGIITKGRMDRKAQLKQAVLMALIHLDPLDA